MPSGRNEIYGTQAWLKSWIEADMKPAFISGVYMDIIPEEVALPAIRTSVMGVTDVRGNASERILVNIDWMILVVREGLDIVPLVPIADRLDLRLHQASGDTPEVWVGTCIRLEPFALHERSDSGVQYRHAGGIYRTMVQAK